MMMMRLPLLLRCNLQLPLAARQHEIERETILLLPNYTCTFIDSESSNTHHLLLLLFFFWLPLFLR